MIGNDLLVSFMNRVQPELLEIALDKAEGFAFERFAQEFLSVVEGRNFVPLGGVSDGGADGFSYDELYETERAGLFYQITTQKDHRAKIRNTFQRLLEFGRKPRTIYYVSSRLIPHIDVEEDDLYEELDVIVKIRDKNYIISHINQSQGTISAFKNHLERYTEFLTKIGNSEPKGDQYIDDPSVYVFLQHELSNRLDNRKIVHSIMDTLILWALRETDPDKYHFKTKQCIYDDIVTHFPWSKSFIKAHFDKRIEELKTKDSRGRQIRWYKKENHYCLPYETREIIQKENIEDEAVKIATKSELILAASEVFDGDDSEYELLADLSLEVIEDVFKNQGLLLSHFISDKDSDTHPVVVSDCIYNTIERCAVESEKVIDYRNVVFKLINKLFYNSSPNQRKYLLSLSRTFVLLFTLKAEPRVIEYFSTMGSNFRLFVGTDIFVKALSERYVQKEDQRCRNILKASSNAGMKLCLSSAVLDEIHSHIKATYWEYINHIASSEQYINKDLIRNCPKILIRAYFYAKERGSVRSWNSFIEQFITYKNVISDKGREELKNYLISEYNLTYYENEELESVVDMDKVKILATTLYESGEKENEALAYNSSLLIHGIYGLRRRDKESNKGSPFGFNTWWLTNQKRITKYTYDLVKSKFAKYIMRPEFVLNFLSISPTCEQVRETYDNVFPSVVGVELGHRLSDDVFHQVMERVNEWRDKEPGRISSMISDLSDQLKSDQLKVYEETVETMEERLNRISRFN